MRNKSYNFATNAVLWRAWKDTVPRSRNLDEQIHRYMAEDVLEELERDDALGDDHPEAARVCEAILEQTRAPGEQGTEPNTEVR